MDQAMQELVTSMLLPAAMAATGLLWLIHVPKMGSIYGFRTSRTESSQEAWIFSHKRMARFWLLAGILCGALTMAIHRWLPLTGRPRTLLCVAISVAAMALAAMRVNRQVREKFPEPKEGEKQDVD